MQATDITSGKALAQRLVVAETFLSRLKGLLGRKELAPGDGLWIKPCNSVHTFGMRFPIDVVFLDRNMQVVSIVRGVRPGRAALHSKAASVLELPVGTLNATGTVIGNYVEIKSFG